MKSYWRRWFQRADICLTAGACELEAGAGELSSSLCKRGRRSPGTKKYSEKKLKLDLAVKQVFWSNFASKNQNWWKTFVTNLDWAALGSSMRG